MRYKNVISLVFFFQAEDGIRDLYVTGVQTCALPILVVIFFLPIGGLVGQRLALLEPLPGYGWNLAGSLAGILRSEERRVGKECRSRRWPVYLEKKKWKRTDKLVALYAHIFY